MSFIMEFKCIISVDPTHSSNYNPQLKKKNQAVASVSAGKIATACLSFLNNQHLVNSAAKTCDDKDRNCLTGLVKS